MSQKIEFKTLDGLVLRGILFPSSQKGPAIIMSPAVNNVKEMFLPVIARRFQQAGVTTLLYDPRTVGESDGFPRNDIDPARQVEDLSDAITYLLMQPSVDCERIGLWGHSWSGMIALITASVDKRAKFVIAICPMVKTYDLHSTPAVLRTAIQDRQQQLTGNKPKYVPSFVTSEIPIPSFDKSLEQESQPFFIEAWERGRRNYNHNVTIQTFARLAKWQPHGLLEFLSPTPTLFIAPERDSIIPAEYQLSLFNCLKTPKRFILEKGKNHFNILTGDVAESLHNLQMKFIRDSFEGNLKQDQTRLSYSKL